MVRSLGERLKELRRVVRLHMNWFTVTVLGRDAISDEELRELEIYDKLPLDESLDFVKKSYVLGRLRAMLKDSEYKHVNYEALNEQVEAASFTSLEDYALQHVKLHAADGIKGLAADIAAGAFDRLKGATSATLNEASVRGIIRDTLAIAVIEKQNSQKVASTLAKDLKTDWSRDWRRVAETELHRAKMVGAAQAIVNKLGIYKNSGGPDSLVSIIPSPTRCEDCGHHFLDAQGNPRVYRLSQLLSQGTNADPGIKHTREGGRHNHWKTTLPPLHPRCGCRIVYIPQGMGWEKGKLRVIDEDIFVEELKKAVDTGSMSATIKPPGPKSTQGPSTSVESAASPPSMAGAPAPGNTPGPGAPKKAVDPLGATTPGGSGDDTQACPFGGDDECESHGGNRSKTHHSDSDSMENHRKALQQGAKAQDPAAAQADQAKQEQEAVNWNKSDKPSAVVSQHLSSGEISNTRPLGQADVGEGAHLGVGAEHAGTTLLVTIDGNGRGIMKPPQQHGEAVMSGKSWTEGSGTVPHGTQAQNEVGAYGFMTHMFGEGFCPVTTMREHDGVNKSVQQWAEGTKQAGKFLADNKQPGDRNRVDTLMRMAADKDAMKEKMGNLIFSDIALNNNDRHMGNLQIVTNDAGQAVDLLPVDHGPTMGNDFMGFKNSLAMFMNRGKYKITIPTETLMKSKQTSFGDLKRSMSGQKDWQCAQTLVRMRYAEHMMETEGHIDYARLQPEIFTVGASGPDRPDARMWAGGPPDPMEYAEAMNNRKLSHEQFEDFALDFLNNAASDESHPDYAFAEEWKEKGILMGPGAAKDAKGHRESGKHKDYEAKVRGIPAEREKQKKEQEDFRARQKDIKAKLKELRARSPEFKKQAAAIRAKVVGSSEDAPTGVGKKVSKGLYLDDPNRPFGG